MTSDGPADGSSPSLTALHPSDRRDGPFILRPLLDAVELSADGSLDDVKINCVDYWDHNLYVGTSASELLHFVQIPPDPNDRNGQSVYILASRLRPAYSEQSIPPSISRPGVQQILLLPRVGKACILCNWTVTFYSLPELSPVFGTTQVKNCNWIGGVDLNEPLIDDDDAERPGVTVLLSLNRKIQVVRIGADARVFKKIDFSGSILSVRRDSFACVADSKSYALLDVDRQLKIPLMNISSLTESHSAGEIGQAQSLLPDAGSGIIRSSSSAQNRPSTESHGHSRSTSLGASFLGGMRRQDPRGNEEDPVFREATPPVPSTSPKPPGDGTSADPPSLDKPLPSAPSPANVPGQAAPPKPKPETSFLKPHIASPTPDEFLLVTGTSPLEPGIGMFVNLDGDPTRPTLEFERYPKEVVVDGLPADPCNREVSQDEEEGYVLVSTSKEFKDGLRHGLEIQRFDAGSEANPEKHWLEAAEATQPYGIRPLIGQEETYFEGVVDRICQRKFSPFANNSDTSVATSLKSSDSRTALSIERLSKEKELFDQNLDSQDEESLPDGWETGRNTEGEEFARRLAKTEARIAVWSGNRIWWAIRNPILTRLDSALEAACPGGYAQPTQIDRREIFTILGSIRGQEARTELDFMTYGFIRQKASVLLLSSLLKSPEEKQLSDGEMKAFEEVIVDSGLDPRVVLSLVPGIRNEIIEGKRGIWVYGGVRRTVDPYLQSEAFEQTIKDPIGTLSPRTMQFLVRFLAAWRKKKGFGSIPDEHEVFRTVDASLLLVLLRMDQNSSKGSGKNDAVTLQLNNLVDKGVDCFDRAVSLLESHHRLFVLSRLYQSRKMAGDVLATWKRIIEGERDDGRELRESDGEQRVREYLTVISSQALVKEYGVWLANRNPKLGVQVFTEDKGRAPKFEPAQVVEMLREEAPAAVKYYLEHLVFGKGHTVYVNDLIAYYLDVVVTELQTSESSRETVMGTYDAYRALQPPKPAYRHFLTDNAPENDEVWHSRLRLLQLLGGSHDYDAAAIRLRLSALPAELLVPEAIILAGRARQHEDALRLLIHNLGDYDSAVSYCIRGGAGGMGGSPPSGVSTDDVPTPEQQRHLFHVVLDELLALDDVSARVEQTGALLERFGMWFEIDDVLARIPDDWSVDIVSGFLVGALRRLVQERHESMLTRALSGSENLRISYGLVVKMGEKGPSIEAPN